jgi:hypothetical protein
MVVRRCCFDGARRSARDELRPHVPVQDHALGALCNGGGGKYRRAAGSRGERAFPLPRPCARPRLRPRPIPPSSRAGAGEAVGIDYAPAAVEAAEVTAAAGGPREVAGLSCVQGQGMGRMLPSPRPPAAGQRGVPCYLKTLSRTMCSSVLFYNRRGFRVADAGAEPRSQVPFWVLRRDPHAAQ